MSSSVDAKVVYRYSRFTYGGKCDVEGVKVEKTYVGDGVRVRLSGDEGGIEAISLTLKRDTAQALAKALEAVAAGYARSMVSEL